MSSPIECGPCKHPLPINSEPTDIKEAISSLLPGVSLETTVVRPTWVKTEGRTIRKSAYIIAGNDGIHPIFSKVIDLLVILDMVIVDYAVLYFDSHCHAYSVVLSDNKSFVSFADLPHKSILHAHREKDDLFIYLKYYFYVV